MKRENVKKETSVSKSSAAVGYVPFGEEWEKGIMKLPKKVLTIMLREQYKKNESKEVATKDEINTTSSCNKTSVENQVDPIVIGDRRKAVDIVLGYMNANFKDKTFTRYIRTGLACDFLCELASAIERNA